MDQLKIVDLECPGCGAALREQNGKAFCAYCGREIILHRAADSIAPVTPPRETQPPPAQSSLALPSERSAKLTFLLALFLGGLGAHRFYTGYTTVGLVYLVTLGLGGFGWAFDLLMLSLNLYKDAQGRPLRVGWMGAKAAFVLLAGTILLGTIVTDHPDAPTWILLPAYGLPLALVNIRDIWKTGASWARRR